MGGIAYDAYRYSFTVVLLFGIFGNILVILSILRQKKNVLKNSYYFFVLHLAICDVAVLILYIYKLVEFYSLELGASFRTTNCYAFVINVTFQFAGVGMMLIISFLRYRATVHPLKPAISRRKLRVVCGLVYLFGLIVGCGTHLPICLIMKSKVLLDVYEKLYFAFVGFLGCFIPTIFMAVVYYKIARALMKQNKYMKRVCSNAMRRPAPDSSFNILRYIRNRRTFLVCLSTVLCYGIAHTPLSVWFIWFITDEYHLRVKYDWVKYITDFLKIVGSQSVNPLIYGILDKKLLAFAKFCCKKKRKTQENLL